MIIVLILYSPGGLVVFPPSEVVHSPPSEESAVAEMSVGMEGLVVH